VNKAEKRSTRIFYNLLGYLVAVASVALATWLKFLAQPTIIPADVPILYLLAIVPTAIFFGFGPALSVCVLSFLAYDYYFIPPIHQITFDITETPIAVIFLVVGVLFSYLASNLREKNRIAADEITARKKTEAELITYRDHLEELVQQRTADLGKTNLALKEEIGEHKKDKEALRQSEQRWATTLASIGDGVVATNVSGRVSFMNTVAEALTGWKTDEANQKPISEVFNIINETTRQKAENPVDKVLQQGIICSLANHTILIRKDGSEISIDDSGAPIKNLEGITTGVVLVFRDITERRKAEKVLRQMEDRNKLLADILERAPQPFGIGLPDGQLGIVNKAFCELTGYSAEELRTLDWAKVLTPPEYLTMETEKLNELVRTGQPVRYEKEYIRKDNSRVPIELLVSLALSSNGQVEYYYSFLTDITERKRLEQERQALLDKITDAQKQTSFDLEAMTKLQKLGAISIGEGDLSSILTEIVEVAVSISGADYGNIQIIDHETSDLKIVAYQGYPNWWLDFWSTVSKGKGTCGTALERGERVIVEDIEQSPIFVGTPSLDIQLKAGIHAVQSTPLISRNGKILGMFSTQYKTAHKPDDRTLNLLDLLARQAADIMESKEAEEELKRRTTELEASNKELEAFSYSVSHDLRAPLRSIAGFSNILYEDYSDKLDEEGKQHLKKIEASSDLMGQLMDDLLKLSRVTRSELNIEKFNLSEMAHEVVQELAKNEPSRQVKVTIESDLNVQGDKNLLNLVLQNLLGNAWKYSSKTTKPRIDMGTVKHNDKQAYFVRDNGVGFDMAYANKLFQPFQRLHKATEFAGTGIGLATVQRIIRRHGGEVWAESTVGEGATFYFTLN